MEHLLEVRNLTTGINKNNKIIKILDNVSFTIDEGEIVGLAGDSGCGKTMSAHSISKLLPAGVKILDGEIIYNNKLITNFDELQSRKLRGNEISVIFQETGAALNPLLKVGKQITETLELESGNKQSAKEKNRQLALEMLASLGFNEPENIFNSYPHQLSGGMCQRVMTAIAVMRRPRLLLADEPSSSLDEESQNKILELLLKMNREYKTSLLVISHDLSIIMKFCGRFLVMKDGKIIEHGKASNFPLSFNPYKEILSIETQKKKDREQTSPLLSVKDVSNSYISRDFGIFGKKKEKPVLNHVNLELLTGEIFGLTGKSGCGKTTLARCILGLVDYNGEILLNGQKPEKAQIQMVFQEPGASLNPRKKIGWLLEEPLVIHKIGNANERKQKVNKMLLRIGLDSSYKSRYVHELSGGQKQRICIGRALILGPRLLIADEAISSLDVSSGAKILNLFRKLNKSTGLGILFISHNIHAVEYLCRRIAVMENGQISEIILNNFPKVQ